MLKKLAKFFPILFFVISLGLLFFSSSSIIKSQTCDDPNQLWCSGRTCPDGWSYGSGCSYFESCDARHKEACENHQDEGDDNDDSENENDWSGCDADQGNEGAGCCRDENNNLYCPGDLECCQGSCQQSDHYTCAAEGTDCSGSCNKNGCSNNCPGRWPVSFYCRGRSQSACGENHNSFLGYGVPAGTIKYSENTTVKKNGEEFEISSWCTTVQADSNAPGSEAVVVFIGDSGEYCVEGTGCNPDNLDWDCSEEPTYTPAPMIPTNTPAPPGPPAPQCTSLNIVTQEGSVITDYSALEVGQDITFECGASAEAGQDVFYQFRVVEPNEPGVIVPNNSPAYEMNPKFTSNVISNKYLNYTIPRFGGFVAQCRVCDHADESRCQEWDPLPGAQQVIPESNKSLPESDESVPESNEPGETTPVEEEPQEPQQVIPETNKGLIKP